LRDLAALPFEIAATLLEKAHPKQRAPTSGGIEPLEFFKHATPANVVDLSNAPNPRMVTPRNTKEETP
jgi:hypothetical protein